MRSYLIILDEIRYGFYHKYMAIWQKKVNLPSKLLRSLYNYYITFKYTYKIYIYLLKWKYLIVFDVRNFKFRGFLKRLDHRR